jgi:hypothetical protein
MKLNLMTRFNVFFTIVSITIVALTLTAVRTFLDTATRPVTYSSEELELAKIEAKRDLLLVMSDILMSDSLCRVAASNGAIGSALMSDLSSVERRNFYLNIDHRWNKDPFTDWLCINLVRLSVAGKLVEFRNGVLFLRVPSYLANANFYSLTFIKLHSSTSGLKTAGSSSTHSLFSSSTSYLTPKNGVTLRDVYDDLIPIENGKLGDIIWLELYRTPELTWEERRKLPGPDRAVTIPESAKLVARFPIRLQTIAELEKFNRETEGGD